MILDSRLAPKSSGSGTMNLALSLLKSRAMWLEDMFANADSTLPKILLGTAELQIGPHLFAATKFYTTHEGQIQFEFSDNPGRFFALPLDLTANAGTGDFQMHFYADPHNKPKRLPSVIEQEWPHYYYASRTLLCIDVKVSGASDKLEQALCEFSESKTTTTWREYRSAICSLNPSVKLWQEFFPGNHGAAMAAVKAHLTARAVKTLHDDKNRSVKSSKHPTPGPDGGTTEDAAHGPVPEGERSADPSADQGSAESYHTANEENEAADDNSVPGTTRSSSKQSSETTTPCAQTPVQGIDVAQIARRLSSPGLYSTPIARQVRRSSTMHSQGSKRRKLCTAGGKDRKCHSCGCTHTPMWRRGPDGTGTLCNACGVRWKNGKLME